MKNTSFLSLGINTQFPKKSKGAAPVGLICSKYSKANSTFDIFANLVIYLCIMFQTVHQEIQKEHKSFSDKVRQSLQKRILHTDYLLSA